jgi:hypothetical protein
MRARRGAFLAPPVSARARSCQRAYIALEAENESLVSARVLTGTALATDLFLSVLQATSAIADDDNKVQHVLLVSIDGIHAVDQKVNGPCTPLWPHNLIRTNIVFGVLHKHGLRTAWSDKHPAYDIINGNKPTTRPVDDFFAPEINSDLSLANINLIHSHRSRIGIAPSQVKMASRLDDLSCRTSVAANDYIAAFADIRGRS